MHAVILSNLTITFLFQEYQNNTFIQLLILLFFNSKLHLKFIFIDLDHPILNTNFTPPIFTFYPTKSNLKLVSLKFYSTAYTFKFYIFKLVIL